MSKGLMNNGLTTSEEEYYFQKGYQQGRADTIDEFVANAITEFQKFDKEHGYPTLGDISVILSDVAEQLKEQSNDN